MSRSTRFTSGADDRKARKRAQIAEGTRLEVWSSLEQQYLRGKLTNRRDSDCWKIKYEESGDHDWILLPNETFRVLLPEGIPGALE
jgi:hypothetical protein